MLMLLHPETKKIPVMWISLEYDEKNTSLPETPDYQRINEFRMFVNEKIVTGKIEKEN